MLTPCSSDSKLLILSFANAQGTGVALDFENHSYQFFLASFLIHKECNCVIHCFHQLFAFPTFYLKTLHSCMVLSTSVGSGIAGTVILLLIGMIFYIHIDQCQLIPGCCNSSNDFSLTCHKFLLFLLGSLLALLAFFSPPFCPLFGVIDFLLSLAQGYYLRFCFLSLLVSFGFLICGFLCSCLRDFPVCLGYCCCLCYLIRFCL